jgi:hypothetical protein
MMVTSADRCLHAPRNKVSKGHALRVLTHRCLIIVNPSFMGAMMSTRQNVKLSKNFKFSRIFSKISSLSKIKKNKKIKKFLKFPNFPKMYKIFYNVQNFTKKTLARILRCHFAFRCMFVRTVDTQLRNRKFITFI